MSKRHRKCHDHSLKTPSHPLNISRILPPVGKCKPFQLGTEIRPAITSIPNITTGPFIYVAIHESCHILLLHSSNPQWFSRR
ncbi:hypothetical protein IF1G_01846 [Cordyceps javanica]|uniref:Uncharacterized protein n=1 Tax=Cordyceps javanica TaxID=43265 RepID=A0A545VD33_9HYPO|nr:hypothetical protein IF1G_01846 [Cordyceps javanica]